MAGNEISGSSALKQRQSNILVIEATQRQEPQKLRVAAYARVSSDSEDQLNSFGAQTRYFMTLVTSKENWTLVDVYADEGISGTSVKKREDFQRLLHDCRKGQIDRVITKSVSRFARNTKECLEAIRELKNLGIGVYFEEQNIDTSQMSGELLTAMFAGMAQAESESISGNMRWSYKRRMQSGKFLPSAMPYGYQIINRKIEVDEEQAQIIRRIYSEYLAGRSMDEIAVALNTDGIPVRNPETNHKWMHPAISYILSNEKYLGNSLWQKTYATDTLPAVQVRNNGERDQYYAYNTHPAIIDEDTYQAVQALKEQRKQLRGEIRVQQENPFQKKIRCGNCGTVFRRKETRGITYWVCMEHFRPRKTNCSMPQIPEESIQRAFCRMFYKLRNNGLPILRKLLSNLTELQNQKMLWSKDIIELNKRICDILDQDRQLSEFNSLGLADPDYYISRKNELASQLRSAKLEKERILNNDGDTTLQQTLELIALIEDSPMESDGFDPEQFSQLIDHVIIDSADQLRFRLKNGLELPEMIERMTR